MCLKSDLEASATNFLASKIGTYIYLLIHTYLHHFPIPIVFIINYYLAASYKLQINAIFLQKTLFSIKGYINTYSKKNKSYS